MTPPNSDKGGHRRREAPDVDMVRRRLIKLFGVLGVGAGVAALADALWPERSPEPGLTVQAPSSTTTFTAPRAETTTTEAVSTTSTEPTTTTTSEPEPTTTTTAPVAVLTVLSKKAWGGRTAGELAPHVPVRLTVHHTAAAGSDATRAPERVRSYQSYHMAQGWADVAYHFLIDRAGRVYQGRSPDAAGDTFTEYDPTGHFLPCLDGSFDVETPSQDSLDALILVLAWGVQEYGIDPTTVAGHRDYAGTKCPGDKLYSLLGAVEAQLLDFIETGVRVQLQFTDEPV